MLLISDFFSLVLVLIIDRLIGDPRSTLHPVALIGNLIAGLEKIFLNPGHAPLLKKIAGAALVVIVLSVVYTLISIAVTIAAKINFWAYFLVSAFLLSFTVSPRSLAEAGAEIAACLEQNDLAAARTKVSYIVGRDTAALDAPEITRATVETVAENIVDGIISPLFYAVIGGAPLAFLYRAVNTMDSMLGYKNEKYKDFGLAAARVDDVFNYIPARLTGVLIVLASFLLRYDAKGAFQSIWRDAKKHPSPNSGFAEAGIAGALGVRLGGLNFYGGVSSFRACMGEAKTFLRPEHIKQTIRVMYGVTVLFVLLTFLGSVGMS